MERNHSKYQVIIMGKTVNQNPIGENLDSSRGHCIPSDNSAKTYEEHTAIWNKKSYIFVWLTS